jgi:hypothetical protein
MTRPIAILSLLLLGGCITDTPKASHKQMTRHAGPTGRFQALTLTSTAECSAIMYVPRAKTCDVRPFSPNPCICRAALDSLFTPVPSGSPAANVPLPLLQQPQS